MISLIVLCNMILSFWVHAVQDIPSTIIWSDSMGSDIQNGNWIADGVVNAAIHSPLNDNEICWNIMRSNGVPNPYIYRITDLSSFMISNHQRLTINYNIIPWNLQSNMQCQVFYAIVTHVSNSNMDWIPIAQYNYTQNGLNVSSNSYPIPINSINVPIAIKFMLYNTPNSRANLIGKGSEQSACYIESVTLALQTERFDADGYIAPKLVDDTTLISGDMSLDIVFIISFVVLMVVLCGIIMISVVGWYCVRTAKRDRDIVNTHKELKDKPLRNIATSLQIVDPSIVEPASWTGHTANIARKLNVRRSVLASADRQPSIEYTEQTLSIVPPRDRSSYSQGLSQVIHKSANFGAYREKHEDGISPHSKMNEGRITPRKYTILGGFQEIYDMDCDKNVDIIIARWEDEQKETVLYTERAERAERSLGETQINSKSGPSNVAVFASSQSQHTFTQISFNKEPITTTGITDLITDYSITTITSPKDPEPSR